MDSYRNEYDQRGALEMFEKAMLRFEMAAEQKGYTVQYPFNQNQVRYDHINCWITKNKIQHSIKVISKKRVDAWDAGPQEEWLWIELHGVREKDPGWLYGGKAQLLAFEHSDHFLVVKRVALQKRIPMIVREYNVDNPNLAEYAIYSRPGRHDKITLIRPRDLIKIPYKIWRF